MYIYIYIFLMSIHVEYKDVYPIHTLDISRHLMDDKSLSFMNTHMKYDSGIHEKSLLHTASDGNGSSMRAHPHICACARSIPHTHAHTHTHRFRYIRGMLCMRMRGRVCL